MSGRRSVSGGKIPLCWSLYAIFIFTLLNFPEGALFNRVNPIRAGIVRTLDELNKYAYCGHSALMGEKKSQWQDTEYVLGFFGKRIGEARREYRWYVEKGIPMGRCSELVGGGSIRSLGEWDEVKKMRLAGQDRIKGDQRIVGDADFVMDLLSEWEDTFQPVRLGLFM